MYLEDCGQVDTKIRKMTSFLTWKNKKPLEINIEFTLYNFNFVSNLPLVFKWKEKRYMYFNFNFYFIANFWSLQWWASVIEIFNYINIYRF